jgi:coproporphyrinogen III oxidase-like Fe-S oxidoreductase
MGLRLAEGLSANWFFERTGATLDGVINPHSAAHLQAQGLIHYDGTVLQATPRGALLLNGVIAALCSA